MNLAVRRLHLMLCSERLGNAVERDIVHFAYDLKQVYYRQFGGHWDTKIFHDS